MVNGTSWVRDFLRSRAGITLLVFLGIGAFLLAYDHRAHLLSGSGLLAGLLLVCVLMHAFMHGGHGGNPRHGPPRDDR